MVGPDYGAILQTAGSIVLGSAPGVGIMIAFLHRLDRRINSYLIEHEILMGWYAKTNNILLKDLPTRSGGVK